MDPAKKEKTIHLSNGKDLLPLIERLLNKRGITGEENIKTFLEPKLENLPSPFLMKDMEVAVLLIEETIKNKHNILIWGDYDVDGTTATALLILFFRLLGVEAKYHIPNRLKDGYGIQKTGLERISKSLECDKTLIITVDNGISANEAINFAKDCGYKIIVTDHHQAPEEEVVADAVINPSQKVCEFGDTTLAGVGIAFYLAMATRSHLSKVGYFDGELNPPNLKDLLDLVAVGTVADMVPLKKLNRILVRGGMEVLARNGNSGLKALCNACNLDSRKIRSEDISFQLAPKINGAGRLGCADNAVLLFISKDKKESKRIAAALVTNNEKRRSINIKDFINAKDEVIASGVTDKYSVIVSGDYHIGVAGIVASNLVEKYKKPSIVLCDFGDGTLKGSARSVPGIDLYVALDECKGVLNGFGGHKMAGGMSLEKKMLSEFRHLFELSIKKQSVGLSIEDSELFDEDIKISQLFEAEVLRQLHLLEPFGQGNPQPIFRDTMSEFVELAPLGKDKKHLRFSFNNGHRTIKGVGFGLGEMLTDCRTKNEKEIFYTPSLNFFRGRRSWQVRVTNVIIGDE